MPSLNLLRGPAGDPRSFLLCRTELTIGRSREANIWIADPLLREIHALVTCDGSQFVLSSATLGAIILVNGQRVRRHMLAHGDRIEMGQSQFIFQLVEEHDARLIDLSSESALEGARLLAEYGQHLCRQYDTEHMLSSLLDVAVQMSQADQGFVLALEGDAPQLVASHNVDETRLSSSSALAADPIIRQVCASGEPLLIEDTGRTEEHHAAYTVQRLALTAVMCLPLHEGGKIAGAVFLGSTQPSEPFHKRLLDLLAPYVALTELLLRPARLVGECVARKPKQETFRRSWGATEIIACSRRMRQVLHVVRKVAPTDLGVLITGEPGTGKALLAYEIHRASRRSEGPFVTIHCAAIPASMRELALFGHATKDPIRVGPGRPSVLEAAHRGTLVLENMGELPEALQARLLAALEAGMDSRTDRPLDVRILATTSSDLAQEMRAGRFHEGLYWRLNPLQIELPPLRERGIDRGLLLNHFLQRASEVLGQPKRMLSRAAYRALDRYRWPGNVAELEQRIRSAVLQGGQEPIELADLGLLPEQLAPRVSLAKARERFAQDYVHEAVEQWGGDEVAAAQELKVGVDTMRRYLSAPTAAETGAITNGQGNSLGG